MEDWYLTANELGYYNIYADDEASINYHEVCLQLGNSKFKCDLFVPDEDDDYYTDDFNRA